VGELYIGGEGVALGYICDPDPQNPRFTKNPLGDGRLYRSGDLARYLNTGEIEFIGRADEQIKIRSYRIELGEIKSVLDEQPNISESAVVVDTSSHGPEIVAYIVSSGRDELDADALRNALANRLPHYMLPSCFVPMPSLPLTPSGKLDRGRLPKVPRSAVARSYAAPRSEIENSLAVLWSEALGHDAVSINDNFFELGGNSFTAMEVTAAARRRGITFNMRDIFRHQTIAELSLATKPIERRSLEAVANTGCWPITPMQRWFFEKKILNSSMWIAAILLEAAAEIEPGRLHLAVKELIRVHEALRLQFRTIKEEWAQYFAEEDDPKTFQVFDLSHLAHDQQTVHMERICSEMQASMIFGKGTLTRFGFFDLGKCGSRVFIAIHHLICDAIGLQVLCQDLTSIYSSFHESGASRANCKLSTSSGVIDWAVLINSAKAAGQAMAEQQYWQPKPIAKVPVDFLSGENIASSWERIRIHLGAEESAALLELSHARYRSGIDVILLWAAAAAVREWQQHDSIFVNIVDNGRETDWPEIDLSRTVGWFTIHYPLLFEINNNVGASHAIRMIAKHLDDVPNHGIGYVVLRYICNRINNGEPVRTIAEPEWSFNYLGNFDVGFHSQRLFRLASEAIGPSRDPGGANHYNFAVLSSILDGKIRVDWYFSSNLYKYSTIEHLSNSFYGHLLQLLHQCERPATQQSS
jgi:non-ribosomal peptide synthase protein (TIGR01720 family)